MHVFLLQCNVNIAAQLCVAVMPNKASPPVWTAQLWKSCTHNEAELSFSNAFTNTTCWCVSGRMDEFQIQQTLCKQTLPPLFLCKVLQHTLQHSPGDSLHTSISESQGEVWRDAPTHHYALLSPAGWTGYSDTMLVLEYIWSTLACCWWYYFLWNLILNLLKNSSFQTKVSLSEAQYCRDIRWLLLLPLNHHSTEPLH